jgi:hypothetical protein
MTFRVDLGNGQGAGLSGPVPNNSTDILHRTLADPKIPASAAILRKRGSIPTFDFWWDDEAG